MLLPYYYATLSLVLALASASALTSEVQADDVIVEEGHDDGQQQQQQQQEYRIGSEAECRGDAELMKVIMDLGDCDQNTFSTFLFDTVHGETDTKRSKVERSNSLFVRWRAGSRTYLGPECTGRCLMKLHRQRIQDHQGAGGSGGIRVPPWTRDDCYDRRRLREMGMSRGQSYTIL